jgi:hypothetical protein
MAAMRRTAAFLAALLVVCLLAVPVAAQSPTSPPTSAEYDLGRCVSALPPPGCGDAPKASGDRGGWAQMLLFGIVAAGMAAIAIVVIRSTRRRDRAMRAS